MSNPVQKRTILLTSIIAIAISIYYPTYKNNQNPSHSKDLIQCSKALVELRNELNDVETPSFGIQVILYIPNLIISLIRTIYSQFKFLSFSFLVYSFLIYLIHSCISNQSAKEVIKLLHIVNVISYIFIALFYTSFKHFHYTSLAWLLFIFITIRLCIR